MTFELGSKVMLDRLVQCANEAKPILVTVFRIVMLVSLAQDSNTLSLILVTPAGTAVIPVNRLQL